MPRTYAKCPPDCTCAKHTRSGGRGGTKPKCEPGCTCGKHNRTQKVDWSDEEARKAYKRQKANERYAADPERFKEAQRRHHEKKRAEDPDYWRKYRRSLSSDLKYRHSITWPQFQERLAAQDGCCYLCLRLLDVEASRGFHIDHDHSCCPGERSCGKCIRGIACHGCNAGIGHFGDDPDQMERVAARLRAANERLQQERQRE